MATLGTAGKRSSSSNRAAVHITGVVELGGGLAWLQVGCQVLCQELGRAILSVLLPWASLPFEGRAVARRAMNHYCTAIFRVPDAHEPRQQARTGVPVKPC